MTKVSHRPLLEFHFRVLDSPVVNAFALPGGYVYVTRGLLAYMNSEAELAGVLGHEIGHITARHGARQYSRAQLTQIGLSFGYAYSSALRTFGSVVELGVGMLFLKFSRDQEQQSVKPPQLKVETVDKSGSLEDFLSLHKNKWLSLEQMAILNGMALSDTLHPGDRIKTLTQ